jgi:hypothetical protein
MQSLHGEKKIIQATSEITMLAHIDMAVISQLDCGAQHVRLNTYRSYMTVSLKRALNKCLQEHFGYE